MWSLAWRLAIFTQKLEWISKNLGGNPSWAIAHSGLPPRFLDIHSRFFVNILPTASLNSTYCSNVTIIDFYWQINGRGCQVWKQGQKRGVKSSIQRPPRQELKKGFFVGHKKLAKQNFQYFTQGWRIKDFWPSIFMFLAIFNQKLRWEITWNNELDQVRSSI